MNWKWLVVLPALAVAPTLTQPAAAQVPAGDTHKLLQRIDELEQKLKILERNRELDKEAEHNAAQTATSVSEGTSGFTVRSADTNFVLKVRGYVQADARFFPGDRNTGSVNDSFLLRRVRPIIEGTVYDKFDYRLMLDFGQNKSSGSTAANQDTVQDAYVTAKLWPEFQIQVGKFKEPVGLERLQSGANMLFIERGFPTQLAPNRDVGIQVQGDLWNSRLSYQAGIFNGVADGGSGDADTADTDKDLAARVFAHPFKDSDSDALRGLGFGVAGTIGNQNLALRTYTTPGQQRFFSYTAGTASAGEHQRVSPQGYYYYGPFGLFGEYIISSQKVRNAAATRRLTHTAWQLATSYFLTLEDNSFKPIAPRANFTLGGPGWGAVELTARVGQLDVDNDAFPTFATATTSASEATSWGVGANWHLNRNIKLSLNYERSTFEGGTTAYLANGEHVILSRVQFSF